MIKKFYIFENTLFSSLNNLKKLNKFEDELKKLIGFDNFRYLLTLYNNKDFTLSFNSNYLSKELNIYYSFSNITSILSQYYEYDIGLDEIYFIDNYFSLENEITFKKLLNILDIDYKKLNDNQVIGSVFFALDYFIDIYDIKSNINEAYKNIIQSNCKKIVKNLPFKLSTSYISGFDIDLDFNIEEIGKYIEKNKLEDINTIYDLLKNVDFSYFNDELENIYEIREIEKIDYSYIQKCIQEQLESVIELFDEEINNSIFKDTNQFSIFKSNEIEKIKNKKYKFEYDIFSKIDLSKINEAKKIGGKILAWFKSYEFQKKYMDTNDPSLEKYKKLINLDIINFKIKNDYEYLEFANIYNL